MGLNKISIWVPTKFLSGSQHNFYLGPNTISIWVSTKFLSGSRKKFYLGRTFLSGSRQCIHVLRYHSSHLLRGCTNTCHGWCATSCRLKKVANTHCKPDRLPGVTAAFSAAMSASQMPQPQDAALECNERSNPKKHQSRSPN